MAVDERARRELQEALMSVIGPDPTDTLLGYLPPTGWADVATTRDVQAMGAELRGEMTALRSEFAALRSEFAALRSEVHAECSDLATEMHHALRTQFYWLVSLLFAILALAGGILVSVLTGPW